MLIGNQTSIAAINSTIHLRYILIFRFQSDI